jgi:aminoglycoside 6'-N-acetyltransferase
VAWVLVPPSPLHGERTVIRPAMLEDADLLVTWHADPEVARFWDGRTFTREEMQARLSRPEVDPYIVESDGGRVGYLQAWFDGDPPSAGGLDMFLIPSARGRGLGPDAARAVAGWLTDECHLRLVTVDPYLSNERAVAAWRKAGFQAIEERPADDDHSEPWLLMTWVTHDSTHLSSRS